MAKFPHTVTRVRAPLVTGAYNRQYRDWANATRAALSANWQPGASTEDVVRQQRTEEFVRLYLAPGADVQPTDRFERDGSTWEVDGQPESWDRGGRGHVKVNLTRVTQG